MILAVDCREFVPGRATGIGRFLRALLDQTLLALAPGRVTP